jgi:hypothetical protein
MVLNFFSILKIDPYHLGCLPVHIGCLVQFNKANGNNILTNLKYLTHFTVKFNLFGIQIFLINIL